MVSNFINVAYNKFTESFKRRTGVPNLKLLVYNSYIAGPILLANTKDLFTCILARFVLEGNKFTVNVVLGLTISTIGAVMFSSKSLCDNMITGSKVKEQNNENEISSINDLGSENAVEIKTENSNNV